jgi:hypothetical protein
MRKLTLTQFMTLDGVVQSPGGPTRIRAAALPRAVGWRLSPTVPFSVR